jgi:hypothetical protein
MSGNSERLGELAGDAVSPLNRRKRVRIVLFPPSERLMEHRSPQPRRICGPTFDSPESHTPSVKLSTTSTGAIGGDRVAIELTEGFVKNCKNSEL